MAAERSHVNLTGEPVDDRTELVIASGELDLYAAPELKRIIGAAIEDGRIRLVVDLTRAGFMDSTALGVLIGAIKRLRSFDGGGLVLASRQPSILRILEITGLDRVIPVYASREEALAAVGEG